MSEIAVQGVLPIQIDTFAAAFIVGVPSAEVIATPVGCTMAPATVVTEPTAEVIATPDGEALAAADVVTDPIAEVIAWPESSTGKTEPQPPCPQVPRPQPLILAIN
mgnify:CR=1 FL=1